MNQLDTTCSICKRLTPKQHSEKHHLIPIRMSKRNRYKEHPQVVGDCNTIEVCKCCGDMLHKLFTIKELAEQYNTLYDILSNEKIQDWVKWIQKKPNDFTVCMASKKRK